MCLAVPSRITAIDEAAGEAIVESLGVSRRAALDLIDEPLSPGDYVLIHIGFIIRKVDQKIAREAIEMHRLYAKTVAGEDDGSHP